MGPLRLSYASANHYRSVYVTIKRNKRGELERNYRFIVVHLSTENFPSTAYNVSVFSERNYKIFFSFNAKDMTSKKLLCT